ncbi:MAG: hypothetical protein IID37_16255 [Planctomycetes bacterium]|nr:hypothetical protein [Planctomycetota bacterium]
MMKKITSGLGLHDAASQGATLLGKPPVAPDGLVGKPPGQPLPGIAAKCNSAA